MDNDILLKTVNKYLLNDIEGACNQGGRFANILSKLESNGQLSSVLLEFLKHRGFHALYRFAARKISFDDYLPLAQEEQNTRRRVAEEAERERQNLARQMSERNEAMQRVWEAEQQRAREMDPRDQAKLLEYGLRRQYGLEAFIARENYPKLMGLLRKLDKGERISKEEFKWLSTQTDENYDDYMTTEVWNRYHAVEAKYLAAEYQRTGDHWHAVNASGHFRKCEEPGQADRLLTSIKISQVKDKGTKLQSALCTTHGGVKRDLKEFDVALKLGLRAHELMPLSYRPCTLLGAVSYEQGNYERGRFWYDKAVQLGFKESQVDNELKNIIRRLGKDKQSEMREHLLSLDQKRYEWANKWGF